MIALYVKIIDKFRENYFDEYIYDGIPKFVDRYYLKAKHYADKFVELDLMVTKDVYDNAIIGENIIFDLNKIVDFREYRENFL